LMCPSAPGRLERRSGIPCSAGAIAPQANVSTGFNKRLEERTENVTVGGVEMQVRKPVHLSSKILQHPDVPLVFDVDGKAAASVDLIPYYSAPPILTDKIIDMYESGTFWFPALRHNKHINVGFIGGHVLSSRDPVSQPFWRWGYQFE